MPLMYFFSLEVKCRFFKNGCNEIRRLEYIKCHESICKYNICSECGCQRRSVINKSVVNNKY